MKVIDNIIDKLLSIVTVCLYAAMIVVVLMQIAARYLPSLTLSWTEELTRFLFVFIICLGAPLSLKYNSFADVDLLYEKFPRPVKKVCYFIIFVLISIFNIVVIYSGYKFLLIGARAFSPALHWPMYLHHGSVFLFGIFALFYSILKLIELLKNPELALKNFESEEIIDE